MLNRGANINLADKDNATPLYKAAEKGHTNTVNVLLGHKKVNINSAFCEGIKYPTSAGFWGSKTERITPFYIAVENGHLDIVKALLKKGAQVTAVCRADKPPLFLAVQRGYHEMVKVLLENGADARAVHLDGVFRKEL